MDSGIARAEKIAGRGDGRAPLAADIVRVHVSEAADRIASAAKQVVAALVARGVDESLAAGVQPLLHHDSIDTISTRRRIAQAVIEAGRAPF